MVKNRLFIWFIPACITLVTTQCNTQSTTSLSGKITGEPGWKSMVYLIQPRHFPEIASNYAGIVADSATLDAEGRFSFPHLPEIKENTLFELCVQKTESRYRNFLADKDLAAANYMPVVITPGKSLDIQAITSHFQQSFSIRNPSPENEALLHLRDLRQQAYATYAPWANTAADESNLLEKEDALRQFQQPLMAFADTCTFLLPSLVAVRWISPESDYERIPEFLARFAQKWRTDLPEHPFVEEIAPWADADRMPIMEGAILPDEALPGRAGDTLHLHRLLGKKLTLLDIWASWCAPCRRENREVLVPLWTKYREQGFQIVGYSIDAGAQAWESAITRDGAHWPQTSHLSGDSTPFMDKLRIATIPANFLLDAQGKILAKNLHGAALTQFVVEYLERN